MKLIIISDIHSNLEALKGFLRFSEATFQKNDFEMVCLGDIVGYGPYPSECLEFVRDKCEAVVRGNHERMVLNVGNRKNASSLARKAIEWTEGHLLESQKEYLCSLPEEAVLESGVLLTHGSPLDPDEYVFKRSNAIKVIEELRRRDISLCFFGHTHLPGIFDEKGAFFYQNEWEFFLEPGSHYLINPGSIGQPRDGNNKGSFCEYDSVKNSVVFHRFTYDIHKTAESLAERGLPSELGERLFYGI
jgi:predicted phosphodiesterase